MLIFRTIIWSLLCVLPRTVWGNIALSGCVLKSSLHSVALLLSDTVPSLLLPLSTDANFAADSCYWMFSSQRYVFIPFVFTMFQAQTTDERWDLAHMKFSCVKPNQKKWKFNLLIWTKQNKTIGIKHTKISAVCNMWCYNIHRSVNIFFCHAAKS